MPNESKTVKTHIITLDKIHDLPGVSLPQYPDRSLGGLVSSIQTSGVKEPVILRQREDGEFELLSGYRRLQASKLAKKADIPAQVYDMTASEATKYFQAIRTKADTPIPGKPVEELRKAAAPVEKKEERKPDFSAKPENKKEEAKKDAIPALDKDGKTEQTAKPGPNRPVEEKGKPAIPAEKKEEKAADEKKPDSPAKPEEKKDPAPVSGKSDEKPKSAVAAKPAEKTTETGKEAATAKKTAQGPGGVAISQVFDPRLDEPDEKALKALPIPKEGEAFFMTLHPGYLEKSVYNNFSVDKESENYKELKKAIELAGIKDPLLARPKKEGGLEILSGQRRHSIAKDLNYCVPVIVQLMDDDDAKILVADSNLHRDKISSYDLSRALRMKMDAMKRKAGRRKKEDKDAPRLNTDEAIAAEMGISTSKFNRILRLSEASKNVCTAYDNGQIELSIASSLSFLKSKTQDDVLGIAVGGGYSLTTKRVERMRALEKEGKLDSVMINKVFQDKDIVPPPTPVQPSPQAVKETSEKVTIVSSTPGQSISTPLPGSPDVKQPEPTPAPSTPSDVNTPSVNTVPAVSSPAWSAPEEDITKGAQERPEHTKVVLSGDRLRKYFPDVSMTPREIEESIYEALDERQKRRELAEKKQTEKAQIFKGGTAR